MNKIEKYSNGMHYVMVDENIVNSFLTKGLKRAICTIGSENFHCAFMPKKEGGYFINLGSTICKKLDPKPRGNQGRNWQLKETQVLLG